MTAALFVFLSFLLAQRLVELAIARRHEKILKARGATEVDGHGYRIIVIMHAAFFISIIAESFLLHREISRYWVILLAIFVAAQALRYWAVGSLGVYWNTKILVAPDHPVIRKGPYRFMKHPNYLAVIIEIAVIPLAFSCYLTAAVFSGLNALALRRRIRIESHSLEGSGEGTEKMPDGFTT